MLLPEYAQVEAEAAAALSGFEEWVSYNAKAGLGGGPGAEQGMKWGSSVLLNWSHLLLLPISIA